MEELLKLRKKYECYRCNTKDLLFSWDFVRKKPILILEGGPRHACLPYQEDADVRATNCRYCGSQDVLWVRRDKKYELTESYGLPHTCDEYRQCYADHKAALREDYAFEKKWAKSQKENSKCKKCNGRGFKSRLRKRRHDSKPYYRFVPCKVCKNIGTFTEYAVKTYLKSLRKKYWPFKPWMRG